MVSSRVDGWRIKSVPGLAMQTVMDIPLLLHQPENDNEESGSCATCMSLPCAYSSTMNIHTSVAAAPTIHRLTLCERDFRFVCLPQDGV